MRPLLLAVAMPGCHCHGLVAASGRFGQAWPCLACVCMIQSSHCTPPLLVFRNQTVSTLLRMVAGYKYTVVPCETFNGAKIVNLKHLAGECDLWTRGWTAWVEGHCCRPAFVLATAAADPAHQHGGIWLWAAAACPPLMASLHDGPLLLLSLVGVVCIGLLVRTGEGGTEGGRAVTGEARYVLPWSERALALSAAVWCSCPPLRLACGLLQGVGSCKKVTEWERRARLKPHVSGPCSEPAAKPRLHFRLRAGRDREPEGHPQGARAGAGRAWTL